MNKKCDEVKLFISFAYSLFLWGLQAPDHALTELHF